MREIPRAPGRAPGLGDKTLGDLAAPVDGGFLIIRINNHPLAGFVVPSMEVVCRLLLCRLIAELENEQRQGEVLKSRKTLARRQKSPTGVGIVTGSRVSIRSGSR